MANGDHEPTSGWRLAAAVLSFASAAWGVVKSMKERRPTVGVTADASVLDRLSTLEKDHAELRREAADDRRSAEQRHQQIFDLLMRIRNGEIGSL